MIATHPPAGKAGSQSDGEDGRLTPAMEAGLMNRLRKTEDQHDAVTAA